MITRETACAIPKEERHFNNVLTGVIREWRPALISGPYAASLPMSQIRAGLAYAAGCMFASPSGLLTWKETAVASCLQGNAAPWWASLMIGYTPRVAHRHLL